jgi:hypothetical protein
LPQYIFDILTQIEQTPDYRKKSVPLTPNPKAEIRVRSFFQDKADF